MAARGTDHLDRLLAAFDICDHDPGPQGRQTNCGRTTNAGACARYDSNLVGKPIHLNHTAAWRAPDCVPGCGEAGHTAIRNFISVKLAVIHLQQIVCAAVIA